MNKFPLNMVLCVRSDAELRLVVGALNAKLTVLKGTDSPDAVTLSAIIDNVTLTDQSGVVKEMADAYVEVGGKKMAEGSGPEMSLFFEGEVAAHSATVALFTRENLEYRMTRIRRASRS